MTNRRRVVIVGASIAGITSAETLRFEGFDGEILILGDEPHLPYSRPPLSKQVLLDAWESERTVIKTQQELDHLGIEFRGSSAAISLNLKERTVFTADGAEKYDDLIIATGARARRIGGAVGIRTLRTIDDALSLRKDFSNAKHVVVIGAGVLGSEIASAGRALGADVTLIGNTGKISFGSIGNALSSQIQDLHREHRVALQLGVNIIDINKVDENTHLTFDNGETVGGDIVVAAIGAIACVEWLQGSGLEIADGIVCDEKGQAAEGVYAIGDVAAWLDPTTGKATRVEHQTNAIEQAMSVAATIVDGRKSVAPVPFFWSDIHGVSIKAYGWFDGQSLNELDSTSEKGILFASQKDGQTNGVISWNLAPTAFRKSRSLVDESVKHRNSKLLIEEQR
jgi:NADPH-dependent 2,4-dienoyl-CoA reductase/sulfur reductase-like enzyme